MRNSAEPSATASRSPTRQRWTRRAPGRLEVEEHRPFRAAVELLTSIPGVGALAARVIVAEVGLDMGRFPTARHLVSSAA